MAELGIVEKLFLIVGLLSLFLFTVSTNLVTVKSSQWNMLFIGVASAPILLYLKKKGLVNEFFAVGNMNEFLQKLSIGLVLGFVMIFFISFAGQGLSSVYNMLGSVTPGEIKLLTSEEVLYVGVIQPITETFLFVLSMILVYEMAKSRFSKVPFLFIFAIFVTSILFAGLHFRALAESAQIREIPFPYEYTLDGFIRFALDFKTVTIQSVAGATQVFTGAGPQLLMGLAFGVVALLYRDFVVPMGMHLTNNLAVLFFATNLTEGARALVTMVVVSLVLVSVLVLWRTKFKYFNEYSSKLLVK